MSLVAKEVEGGSWGCCDRLCRKEVGFRVARILAADVESGCLLHSSMNRFRVALVERGQAARVLRSSVGVQLPLFAALMVSGEPVRAER